LFMLFSGLNLDKSLINHLPKMEVYDEAYFIKHKNILSHQKKNKKYLFQYMVELEKLNRSVKSKRQTILQASQDLKNVNLTDRTFILDGALLREVNKSEFDLSKGVTLYMADNSDASETLKEIINTRNEIFKIDDITKSILEYEQKISIIDHASLSFKKAILDICNGLSIISEKVGDLMKYNFNYIYSVKEHVDRFINYFSENNSSKITFMITQYNQVIKTINYNYQNYIIEEKIRNTIDIKDDAISNYCAINGLRKSALVDKLTNENNKEEIYTHCHVGILTGSKKVLKLVREYLNIDKTVKFELGSIAFKETFCKIYDFSGDDNKYFNIINTYLARVFQQFEIYNRNINVIYNVEAKYTSTRVRELRKSKKIGNEYQEPLPYTNEFIQNKN